MSLAMCTPFFFSRNLICTHFRYIYIILSRRLQHIAAWLGLTRILLTKQLHQIECLVCALDPVTFVQRNRIERTSECHTPKLWLNYKKRSSLFAAHSIGFPSKSWLLKVVAQVKIAFIFNSCFFFLRHLIRSHWHRDLSFSLFSKTISNYHNYFSIYTIALWLCVYLCRFHWK